MVQNGKHPEHPKWKPVRDKMHKGTSSGRPLLKKKSKGGGKGGKSRGKGRPYPVHVVETTGTSSKASCPDSDAAASNSSFVTVDEKDVKPLSGEESP